MIEVHQSKYQRSSIQTGDLRFNVVVFCNSSSPTYTYICHWYVDIIVYFVLLSCMHSYSSNQITHLNFFSWVHLMQYDIILTEVCRYPLVIQYIVLLKECAVHIHSKLIKHWLVSILVIIIRFIFVFKLFEFNTIHPFGNTFLYKVYFLCRMCCVDKHI